MFNVGKNKKNGFTLIEIIASIAILGMVIAVFLPIFPQIMSWSNKTEQNLVAGNLLEQAIYDIKENQSIKLNGSIPNCPSSELVATNIGPYEVNNITYSVLLNVCQDKYKEEELGLYRANVKITTSEGVQSESYTYLHGDAK